MRSSPKNFKDKKKVGFYFSLRTLERLAWVSLKRTREGRTPVFKSELMEEAIELLYKDEMGKNV